MLTRYKKAKGANLGHFGLRHAIISPNHGIDKIKRIASTRQSRVKLSATSRRTHQRLK